MSVQASISTDVPQSASDAPLPPSYDNQREANILIARLKILQAHKVCPTPRLTAALNEGLRVAQEQKRGGSAAAAYDANQAFIESWRSIMSEPMSLSWTLLLILDLAKFLTNCLKIDYLAVKEQNVDALILDMAKLVTADGSSMPVLAVLNVKSVSSGIHSHIKQPLDEMLISVEHAISKLSALVHTNGRVTSSVRTLSARRAFKDLARLITMDKEMLAALFSGSYITTTEYTELLRGIGKVQTKHFRSMVNENNFTPKNLPVS